MLKVIDNKTYDTDNSELICDSAYYNFEKVACIYSGLHKDSDDEYFLEIRYTSSQVDNAVIFEDLMLVSEDEAAKYMEHYLEEYEPATM